VPLNSEVLNPALPKAHPLSYPYDEWVDPVTGWGIPKDRMENAEKRLQILDECEKDHQMRKDVWWACSQSVLAWINLFCIAEGTLVLTDRGLVPIERVKISDRVWDGDQWVRHDGVAFRGEKEVGHYYSAWMTPDHKVWTVKGWSDASNRFDRASVRMPHGCSVSRIDHGYPAAPQRIAAVYDLLNCGPRQAFTIIGDDGLPLLVHNCWTYVVRDVREGGNVAVVQDSHVPFITWPVQDAAILDIKDCIDNQRDVIIDKSRDMGASWIVSVALPCWYWLFRKSTDIGLCSRVEDEMDMSGNMRCVFQKIDYLLQNLPEWMLPVDSKKLRRGTELRTHMKIINPMHGSSIVGEASTDDQFRGGRYLFVVFDEFASHAHAKGAWISAADSTHCRIGNSTPLGPGTEFTRQRNRGVTTGSPRIVTLGYWDHPMKGKGRVPACDEHGEIADVAGRWYWNTDWFRHEIKRRADKQDICQNILIDHVTSGDTFFRESVVTLHMQNHAKEPKRHRLVYTDRGWKFVLDSTGNWFVWCPIENGHAPKGTHYIFGVDLSSGKGSANSVIAVLDNSTGEFVAEYADPYISTYDLAEEAAQAAQSVFMGGDRQAFIWYESNGPGESWYKDLMRFGAKSIYMRRNLTKVSERNLKEWGWRSDRRQKEWMLRELDRSLTKGDITIRSRACLDEMLGYVRYDTGEVGPGTMKDEVTGARESHGDRVIAHAGANMARREVPEMGYDEGYTPTPGTADAELGITEFLESCKAEE